MTTHRDRTRAHKAETLPEIVDLEEKSQAKKRRCLICNASFDSFGPGNRICPTCKSSARWKTGW
jgi:tRNA(Ile2) C34 agmatinyltransferase TiaS